MQCVINRINHKRQEVIHHAEYQRSFAQRHIHKVEKRHCRQRTNQDIDPHGKDEEHYNGLRILHSGLRQNVSGRITQQNAHDRRNNGNANGIDKRIDGLRMGKEFSKITESKMPGIVHKCINHYQKKRKNNKYRRKYHVRDSPTLTRGQEELYCSEHLFSFLLIYNLYYFNLFRQNTDTHMVTIVPYIVGIYINIFTPVRCNSEVVMVAFVKDKTHIAG